MKVYKYQFLLDDRVVIAMPVGAQILRVAVQDGMPTLWALVDTKRDIVDHHFLLRGTGHDATGCTKENHIETFFHGPFVWHFFHA